MADMEAETKGRGETTANLENGIVAEGDLPLQVLSDKKLFVLGTGVFALWAVSVSPASTTRRH